MKGCSCHYSGRSFTSFSGTKSLTIYEFDSLPGILIFEKSFKGRDGLTSFLSIKSLTIYEFDSLPGISASEKSFIHTYIY